MSLGMELSLDPGDLVLHGDSALPPLSPKGGQSLQSSANVLLRPNGWIDEAGTWNGGRP